MTGRLRGPVALADLCRGWVMSQPQVTRQIGALTQRDPLEGTLSWHNNIVPIIPL